MIYLPLLIACLAAVIWGISIWRAAQRRRKAMSVPFPDSWWGLLDRNLPLTRRLPAPLRSRLEISIRSFLTHVPIEGAGGLEIDDEIRVTVAGQACLMVLGNGRTYEELRSVIVYPTTYRQITYDSAIGHVAAEHENLGESHGGGYVVLAWDATKRGTIDPTDGQNVAIHEFAHQLDQENSPQGEADGIPVPSGHPSYATWAKLIDLNLRNLQRNVRRGASTVLDPYGAQNEAEFFAVATEAYFERPEELERRHPKLFELLEDFYQLDTLSWHRR